MTCWTTPWSMTRSFFFEEIRAALCVVQAASGGIRGGAFYSLLDLGL